VKAKISPPNQAKQFPPSVKKQRQFDVPGGIIAHLTRQWGGNVHDRHVADITPGSFQKETVGANPHSGAYGNNLDCAAKNAADLESDSRFYSACRWAPEDIPHTKNNWICHDFKERRIGPTHYAVRTHYGIQGGLHLRSCLIETSADGKSWQEVAREDDNDQLNDTYLTGTFALARARECRFIQLVNIERNHSEEDHLAISAWEVFEGLAESTEVPPMSFSIVRHGFDLVAGVTSKSTTYSFQLRPPSFVHMHRFE
jgi:hypothetical protein